MPALVARIVPREHGTFAQPMDVFEELKRYVRFEAGDESALRALAPHAAPHFSRIVDEFYARIEEHSEARNAITSPEQVGRLKETLCAWMGLLLTGPWDDAYQEKRAHIGRVHVRIGLPQRYMFGGMNLVRVALTHIAQDAFRDDPDIRQRAVRALSKMLDIELGIMLESYRIAFVEKVQHLERLEKLVLERRLALSEASYEEIVERGEALIATTEPDGHILLFNGRCEEITGVNRSDAAGRDWLELFAPVSLHGDILARRAAVLAGSRVAPFEGPVTGPGGERRVRWHFTTLPGPLGPLICSIGIDITEEWDAQVRTRRAQRLAALGTMAAGLAHEIRNPLNAAHLQLTLVQRRLGRAGSPDNAGAAQAAELAATEMKRLASLVEEFLQFARPQPLRLASGDLRATADTIATLLKPEAGAAGVELRVEGASATAEYDDERMKQVLHNLVRNAVEATGRGGHVSISVEPRDGEVLLAVLDDGPGLESPDAPIFEPFYTTKEGGTGLGLAIVHRIVSDHGGRVDVESRPGRTMFRVRLPRAGADANPARTGT
jgi:PAS domain S-box-containing protein